VFIFPGGGAQYAAMARALYETEPVFRAWMDRGLAILEPRPDDDLRAPWLPGAGGEAPANRVAANRVLAALRHPEHPVPDDQWFRLALMRCWALGLPADWAPIRGEAPRRRVPFPTCPLERQRYVIDPGRPAAAKTAALPPRIEDPARWGFRPVWLPEAARVAADVEGGDLGPPRTWLVLADGAGLADACCARLTAARHRLITLRAGDTFARLSDTAYALAPERGRAG
jgi:acyl transferase domain-containing protein